MKTFSSKLFFMAKTRRERCPYCGFLDVIKWGRRDGHQRYKWRSGCFCCHPEGRHRAPSGSVQPGEYPGWPSKCGRGLARSGPAVAGSCRPNYPAGKKSFYGGMRYPSLHKGHRIPLYNPGNFHLQIRYGRDRFPRR